MHQQNPLQNLTSLRRNWPISIGLSGPHASVPEIVGFAWLGPAMRPWLTRLQRQRSCISFRELVMLASSTNKWRGKKIQLAQLDLLELVEAHLGLKDRMGPVLWKTVF